MGLSNTTQALGWDEVNLWAYNIAARLPLITHMVAIGGGGIVPAALISFHYYQKYMRHVDMRFIYAKSYKDREQLADGLSVVWPSPQILADLVSAEAHVLVVDDISDTGKTLEAVVEKLPMARLATLIFKPQSSVEPQFYGHRGYNNIWYEFPWERD